jgi:hypothetical protein
LQLINCNVLTLQKKRIAMRSDEKKLWKNGQLMKFIEWAININRNWVNDTTTIYKQYKVGENYYKIKSENAEGFKSRGVDAWKVLGLWDTNSRSVWISTTNATWNLCLNFPKFSQLLPLNGRPSLARKLLTMLSMFTKFRFRIELLFTRGSHLLQRGLL